MAHIEFDRQLAGAGADFYMTLTTDQAFYRRYSNGSSELAFVPPDSDIAPPLVNVTDASCPIGFWSGRSFGGVGGSTVPPLEVGQGRDPSSGVTTVGDGVLQYNLTGTFRVVPDAGENFNSVKLLVKGIMDGVFGVNPNALAPPPSASLNASIFVENLGTVTGAAQSAGTVAETAGLAGTISAQPGAVVNATRTTQTTTSSTFPVNVFMMGKMPVNTPLQYTFIVTLQAHNGKNALGGCGASWAWLSRQFVLMTPAPPGGGTDPLYSASLFSFDVNTKLLGIAHPLTVLGTVTGPATVEDDGTVGAVPSTGYTSFLPEVDLILSNGDFNLSDGLVGSLITYTGLTLGQPNSDGTIPFSNGALQFIDGSDRQTVRAQADLTSVLADPGAQTFIGTVSNFILVNAPAQASPLAAALAQSGGQVIFDPAIMTASQNFTQSATTSLPFDVILGPTADF